MRAKLIGAFQYKTRAYGKIWPIPSESRPDLILTFVESMTSREKLPTIIDLIWQGLGIWGFNECQ